MDSKNTDFSICKIFKVILDSNHLLCMFAKNNYADCFKSIGSIW